jgi:hypothetical protein
MGLVTMIAAYIIVGAYLLSAALLTWERKS